MLNQDQIQGKWSEIKGGLRNLWGKLSNEEIDHTEGNISQIYGLVQSKYNVSKEEIKDKLERLMNSFDNATDKGLDPDRSSYGRSPVQDTVDREVSSFRAGYSDNKGLQVESSAPARDDTDLHDKSFSSGAIDLDEDGDDRLLPDDIVEYEDQDDDLTYEAQQFDRNHGRNASEDRIARH